MRAAGGVVASLHACEHGCILLRQMPTLGLNLGFARSLSGSK